ncbi:hypothetical protein [Pseudomonas syringae]|uniref:PD-(D/E)XK nuclease domain-containing protein n=1 Tax=Pseudomonas syringae TaxID=317 RepID=UPI0005160DBB|nr:hypothetical protein [Pseudomonas syringae]
MENLSQKKLILKFYGQSRQLVPPLAQIQIQCAEWEIRHGDEPVPIEWIEEQGELEHALGSMLEKLHVAIISYLSPRDKAAVLEQYYLKFGNGINALRAATAMEHLYEIDEYHNVHLSDVYNFLAGLDFFDSNDTSQSDSIIEILERVLRNTSQVLSQSNSKITSEISLQKALKNYLQVIFPSVIGSTSPFSAVHKQYYADIYVPELGVAVEIKLSKTKTELDSAIAAIDDDVKGYAEHSHYRKFFVLFYVVDDFLGSDRFFEVWKSRNHPENWTPIYVIGKKFSDQAK